VALSSDTGSQAEMLLEALDAAADGMVSWARSSGYFSRWISDMGSYFLIPNLKIPVILNFAEI